MSWLRNARSRLRYFRLTPFDAFTEEGRAAERYRLAAWSVVANVASKLLSMAVVVISVALTTPYLGAERFGVWMTIASFAGMLSFLDLGIANALINRVAHAAANSKEKQLPVVISGGLALLFVLAALAGALLLVVAALFPWQWLLNSDDSRLLLEVRTTGLLFAAFFGMSLFANGISSIFAGLQMMFRVHLASGCASIASIALLVVIASRRGDISELFLATFAVQALSPIVLLLFLYRSGFLRTTALLQAARDQYRPLLRSGSPFFFIQLAGIGSNGGADSLIVATTLGVAQVATFNVVQRLFQFVSQPLLLLHLPLWAGYADAHARGDRAFIRNTLRHSLAFVCGAALIGCALVAVAAQWLAARWTGGNIDVPTALVVMFALRTLSEVCGAAYETYLIGCGLIKPHLWSSLAICLGALPVKILLAIYAGAAGLVAGTVIIYVVVLGVTYGFLFRAEVTEPLRRV